MTARPDDVHTPQPQPRLLVMKFGGTLMGSSAAIRHSASLVQRSTDRGTRVVVVVSAMTGVTNQLLRLADAAEAGDIAFANDEIAIMRNRHFTAAQELGLQLRVVSRSDSTLRGHYPLETDVMAEELSDVHPVAGTLLVPAFIEGGRVTHGGVHYLIENGTPVPVAANATGITRTGLTNGTAYVYVLAFQNAGGTGPAATASGTPAAPAVAAAVFNTAAATKYSYYYDVQYGQSLSAGLNGDPPLTTTMHPRAVSMGPNIVNTTATTAYFSTALYENGVETGMAAGADTIYRYMEAQLAGASVRHMDTLHNTFGISGQGYAQLAKGTSFYNVMINSVIRTAQAVQAAGKTLVVPWISMVHGEADESSSNANYAANLATWQADIQTDLRAATGQTEPIPFVLSQSQSNGFYNHPTPTTDQQMYLAFKANPSTFVLAMPKYHLPHSDAVRVHLTNIGYRTMGQKYGQVKTTLFTDKPWRPLYPTSVTGAGTSTITAVFNVPYGPLQWDTTTFEDHANGAKVSRPFWTSASRVFSDRYRRRVARVTKPAHASHT